MKKKFLGLFFAAALAAAMPVMAFAASPDGSTDTTPVKSPAASDEVIDNTPQPIFTSPDANGDLKYYASGAMLSMSEDLKLDTFEVTDEPAGNFDAKDADYTRVESYKIESKDFDAKGDTITLAWYAGVNETGYRCHIYVEHGDGTFDEADAGVDANGYVTVIMDKLSTVTFALTDEKYEGELGPVYILSKDTKATSPKTGGIL